MQFSYVSQRLLSAIICIYCLRNKKRDKGSDLLTFYWSLQWTIKSKAIRLTHRQEIQQAVIMANSRGGNNNNNNNNNNLLGNVQEI